MSGVYKIESPAFAGSNGGTGVTFGHHGLPVSKNATDQSSVGTSVYRSLRPVLLPAAWFGMLPIENASSCNGRRVRFRWLSLVTLRSLLFLGALLFTASLSLISFRITFSRSAVTRADLRNRVLAFGSPLYFFSSFLSLLFCFRFARQLPSLLEQWDSVASLLTKYVSTSGCKKIHLSVYRAALFSAFVFVLPSFIEHALHNLHRYSSSLCADAANFFDCYISDPRGGLFYLRALAMPSSTAMGIVGYFIGLLANVAWNFNDLLVALLARALEANFRVISKHVQAIHRRYQSDGQWRELREAHLMLCALVQKVDSHVSLILLHSYAFNIYCLCYQVYFGIRPSLHSTLSLEALYAIVSFVHMALRVCALTYSAGQMYNQIRAPMTYLHLSPVVVFSEEVSRFICQISGTSAAFTGCGFFVLNHKLFLTITGVIFTYELILLE